MIKLLYDKILERYYMWKKFKYSIIIGSVNLVLLSVLLFGVWSKLTQKSVISSYISKIENKSTRELSKLEQEIADYNTELAKSNNGLQSLNYDELLNKYEFLSNQSIIGVVSVDKISMRLPIYYGTTDEILMKGVGLVDETYMASNVPGTKSILTGHNGLLGADMLFTRLDELDINDTFKVHIGNETLVYKIKKTMVVTPEEANEYAYKQNSRDSKAEVTLITCTPYGINTHRLIHVGEFMHKELGSIKINDVKKQKISIGKETAVIIVLLTIGTSLTIYQFRLDLID